VQQRCRVASDAGVICMWEDGLATMYNFLCDANSKMHENTLPSSCPSASTSLPASKPDRSKGENQLQIMSTLNI
jgi:hypothetical protein